MAVTSRLFAHRARGFTRRLEATMEEIIRTVHAHPTMHESVREAALASEGRVVNS